LLLSLGPVRSSGFPVLALVSIWLLIVVFSGIFCSYDLSGWGSALWVIFVVISPLS
jgi:hypothetical protein